MNSIEEIMCNRLTEAFREFTFRDTSGMFTRSISEEWTEMHMEAKDLRDIVSWMFTYEMSDESLELRIRLNK